MLHDAFFKHQTKPSLTPMGDLYYEGKEFEARVRACFLMQRCCPALLLVLACLLAALSLMQVWWHSIKAGTGGFR